VFSHIDNSAAANFALAQTPAGGTLLNTKAGQPMLFRVGNAEKIAMDTNGKLGIGTTSPAHPLHVVGGTSSFTVNPSSTLCVIGTASAAATNSDLYIDTKGAGSIYFRSAAGTTALMTISSAGAVSGVTVGGSFLASKAEMEAATAADHIVTPAIMNDHPGMVKCWVSYNQSTAAILAEHNTSSVTDSATGRSATVWDTDFSAATYATGGTANAKVANHGVELIDTSKATTGCGYACKNFATNTDGDTTDLNIWAAGDQ
jgi:hypothetical protein